MARFVKQPCFEIKDVLDFLLNMIRCPYELLLCCHRGTCILYGVITEACIWLFQCITHQGCETVCVKKSQTVTDMRSMSALFDITTPDALKFVHSFEEITSLTEK